MAKSKNKNNRPKVINDVQVEPIKAVEELVKDDVQVEPIAEEQVGNDSIKEDIPNNDEQSDETKDGDIPDNETDQGPQVKEELSKIVKVFENYAINYGKVPAKTSQIQQLAILTYVRDGLGTEFGANELVEAFSKYTDKAFQPALLGAFARQWGNRTSARNAYLSLVTFLSHLVNGDRDSIDNAKLKASFKGEFAVLATKLTKEFNLDA